MGIPFGVAHRLHNHLQPIMSYLEFIEDTQEMLEQEVRKEKPSLATIRKILQTRRKQIGDLKGALIETSSEIDRRTDRKS